MNITHAFRLIVFVLAVAPAWPAVANTSSDVGRRYALIIGVPEGLRASGLPKLNFVVNDVERLKELLDREGYQVKTVPEDRADRKRILEELYRHARLLTEKDTFVLYYAGHGLRNVEVNRKTYWLTYDAEIDMLDVQGIRLEHLLSYIQDIRAGRKLILLDHCFSGDVENVVMAARSGSGTATAGGAAAAPAPADAPRIVARSAVVSDLSPEISQPSEGTLVIAAARDLAYELPDFRHGVFTKAILDACGMSQGSTNHKRRLPDLVVFINERVEELLKAARAPAQTPVNKSHGDIVKMNWPFCNTAVPKAKVAEVADALAASIQQWESKGLLSARRRLICAGILDRWKAAEGDPGQLTRTDSRVLSAIRLYADPEDRAPEDTRAAALNDAIGAEGFQ